MLKIVFWARLPFARALVAAQFAALPGIRFVVCDSQAECLAAMPEADGMLVYNAKEEEARPVVEALHAPGNRVRWLHFLTAGREGFDAVGLPAGIRVTQAAGASAPVVAEHALALLLALARRVPDMLERAAQQRWDRGIAARCSSLEGRTMAIVGYGQIGQQIARRARGFGLQTIAVSRSGRGDALVDAAARLSELHPVLARCDVLMIAIALAPETRGLIDRAALAACRPGTLLVNVARGAVLDQVALRDALASGHLAGAGLDVTYPEPPPPGDPLWTCPNLILSPHIAVEGSEPTARRIADGAMHFFKLFQQGSAPTPETSP